jgi:hypothetical protein
MLRPVLGLTLVAAAFAAAPARADCNGGLDVAQAFAKQREKKTFRMDANVYSAQGPLKMTLDYILPDRLHQSVQIILEQKGVDAILVGQKAWANEGDGWKIAPPEIKEELDHQLTEVAEETAEQVGRFTCLGNELVDGRELAAYRAEEEPPKPDGQGGAAQPAPQSKPPTNESVRIVYIDLKTGLPARTVIGRPTQLDRPLFKADYSYPDDIKIEPPAGQ